ncbi:hypothetical protein ACHWQZ_G003301 [Mnemiopsis leidyi]
MTRNKQHVLGIFIDLSKAFDTIDHQKLITKLNNYGIRGNALRLIDSYLSNRKQFVSVLDVESDQLPVHFGVPQGSVLGPLLFVLYINDICNITNKGKFVLFADDTNIFVAANSKRKAYDIANEVLLAVTIMNISKLTYSMLVLITGFAVGGSQPEASDDSVRDLNTVSAYAETDAPEKCPSLQMSPDEQDPNFPTPVIEHPQEIEDFEISEKIILLAVKEINADSAPGPNGASPILLKNCVKELCSPLRIIWEQSFERSSVPMFFKGTLIAPLYKKGDRARRVNYRPVTFTSHDIKVYKRILRSVKS